MAEPVVLTIAAAKGVWTLLRDGVRVTEFGHADRAVHEAVRLARELEETGQPARVELHAAEGKVIAVDHGPDVTQDEELRGAAARI